jgi:hypothetical protein
MKVKERVLSCPIHHASRGRTALFPYDLIVVGRLWHLALFPWAHVGERGFNAGCQAVIGPIPRAFLNAESRVYQIRVSCQPG